MNDEDDGRCNYSALDPETGIQVPCIQPFLHHGPCVGVTIDDYCVRWCGRVCIGCEHHGDPEDPILVAEFVGDTEAVSGSLATIGCMLPK
jgi:hypothetical protein